MFKTFIILFGYSFASLCAGAVLLRLLRYGNHQSEPAFPSAMLASQFLLGVGFLANLWLVVAMAGWFSPLVILVILAAFSLTGLYFIRPQLISLASSLGLVWSEFQREAWYWDLIVFLTWLLALGGITRLGYSLLGDGTAVYLTLPKFIAASHRFTPMPGFFEVFTARIGLLGEFHYAALMSLGLTDTARLFEWVTIMAGAFMLKGICSLVGVGLKGQRLALAMIFTSTNVMWLVCGGKVDLFAAAMGLAAVYWALSMDISGFDPALRLTGLYTGLAVLAKLSYAYAFLPCLAVLAFWQFIRTADFSRSAPKNRTASILRYLKLSTRLACWALLPLVPHIVKIAVWLGNPLTQLIEAAARRNRVRFSPSDTRKLLFTYPLALFFGKYPGQYGNLSPLILAFAPLAMLMPKPESLRKFLDSKLTMLTMAALIGTLFWIVLRPTGLQTRYFLAVGLLFIPLAARGAEAVFFLRPRRTLLRIGIIGCTLFTILWVGAALFSVFFSPYKTALYLAGDLPICQRDGDICEATAVLNEKVPIGERVLYLSFHTYWLRPDLLQCIMCAKDVVLWDSSQNYEQLWTHVCKQGFRYLFIDKTLRPAYLKKIKHRPPWVKIKTLYDKKTIVIYQLDFVSPPVKPAVKCRQIKPPAWDLVPQ